MSWFCLGGGEGLGFWPWDHVCVFVTKTNKTIGTHYFFKESEDISHLYLTLLFLSNLLSITHVDLGIVLCSAFCVVQTSTCMRRRQTLTLSVLWWKTWGETSLKHPKPADPKTARATD